MTVGAERGEIAEVGSPVVVPPDEAVDARRPLGWTTGVILVATLFLAIFNAGSATEWLDEQTPTATIERLRAPVEGWSRATAALHADAARTHLRRWWQALRAARFGDERPGEPGTM
ncbi:hypothetical protein [Sphingomonas rubra]|uniref:Uncharacterized protein n=1 Tax=Sphingomonas rubra TaxID=634430 RepID=A0A1I5RPP4_9SPHN|nr:hypothetical protein [Sphingomonas rubra]SFP60519.1 hypothetical protein SAMN04488241_10433 [Sphingomonas rubra]